MGFGAKFLTLSLGVASGFGNAFTPTKISFDEFLGNGIETSKKVQDALADVGIISVNNIPGFKQLRQEVLKAASVCALDSKEDYAAVKATLRDDSVRYTLGAQTVGGQTEDFLGFDKNNQQCADFMKLEKEFRDLFSESISAFAGHLDNIFETNGQKHLKRNLLFDTEKKAHITSIDEIVREGMQLEHFHTYEKAESNSLSALEMHVDQGLFIALTPAETFFAKNPANHGFYMELPSGEVVEPDFGERDEIVFFLGDGFHQWITPKVDIKLRPLPHTVVMPESTEKQTVRSWYGKMMLPKPSSFLESHGMTFGELRSEIQNKESPRALGACSNNMDLIERRLQECGENTILCWHSCAAITCDEGDSAICGTADLVECDNDPAAHHPECALRCIAPLVPTTTPSTSPSASPVEFVSEAPSTAPSTKPTNSPVEFVSDAPSENPTVAPTGSPVVGASGMAEIGIISVTVALLAQI